MGSLKRVGIILLAVIGFSACAVETPTVEDIFPATQNGAVQAMYIAQFVRWATLTNDSTSYTVDSFSVVRTNLYVSTNLTLIEYEFNTNDSSISTNTNVYYFPIYTNLSEAVVDVTFKKDILPYDCHGQFHVLVHDISERTNVFSVNDHYSNFVSFNDALSNAVYYYLSGTLYYTNGDVNILTKFAGLEFEPSEGGVLFTNERNNFVEDSTIQVDTNYDDIFEMTGVSAGESFRITPQEGFTMTFSGSLTNALEMMSGSIPAFYSTLDYSFNSWYQTDYPGNPTLEVSFSSVEKLTGETFDFNLSNL